jgi:hypothetical protein
MRSALRFRWLGWLFPATLLLASCGSPPPNFGQSPVRLGGAFPWAYSLAGPVAKSPALLAIVTNKHGGILAYACDGQQVAEWFVSVTQQQSVDITNTDGSRLQVTFSAQNARGMLTLPDGPPLPFQINLAQKPAGLYSAKEEPQRGLVAASRLKVRARERGAAERACGNPGQPTSDQRERACGNLASRKGWSARATSGSERGGAGRRPALQAAGRPAQRPASARPRRGALQTRPPGARTGEQHDY